MNNNNFNF